MAFGGVDAVESDFEHESPLDLAHGPEAVERGPAHEPVEFLEFRIGESSLASIDNSKALFSDFQTGWHAFVSKACLSSKDAVDDRVRSLGNSSINEIVHFLGGINHRSISLSSTNFNALNTIKSVQDFL